MVLMMFFSFSQKIFARKIFKDNLTKCYLILVVNILTWVFMTNMVVKLQCRSMFFVVPFVYSTLGVKTFLMPGLVAFVHVLLYRLIFRFCSAKQFLNIFFYRLGGNLLPSWSVSELYKRAQFIYICRPNYFDYIVGLFCVSYDPTEGNLGWYTWMALDIFSWIVWLPYLFSLDYIFMRRYWFAFPMFPCWIITQFPNY